MSAKKYRKQDKIRYFVAVDCRWKLMLLCLNNAKTATHTARITPTRPTIGERIVMSKTKNSHEKKNDRWGVEFSI